MSKTTENVISQKKYVSMFEKEEDSQNTILFKRFIKLYIETKNNLPENITPELEVRFGTKKIKYLTKINFNNVIKTLLFNDFKLINENYSLKIILENENSNIRTEIIGLPNIQYYCKNNNINEIEDINNVKFV